METISGVNGLVMAIEAKKILALYPSLRPLLKWKIEADSYEMQPVQVQIALELLKRRSARLLD